MALLLALASAFAIFALVFTASQAQHVLDIAAYQVGSDFSGTIVSATSQATFQKQQTMLQHIPGIASVTMGYEDNYQTNSATPSPVTMLAVDATTFSQTAIWNVPGTNLSSLMQQLVAQRQSAVSNDAVAVLVDSQTWSRLDLSPGAKFSVQVAGSTDKITGAMTFVAIAQVPHIPTVNDSTEPGDNNGSPLPGGLIADYQTFTNIYHHDIQQAIYANHVWLRTAGNSNQLPAIRNTLTKDAGISALQDRYALIDSLSSDPLYLDLIGELVLGASTALFLALLGNLLASWLSARGRLTNFAILRALGTSPSQVASVLTWEQCITYIVAIILGVGFGALLCATIIPSLVITSVPVTNSTSPSSNGGFYALQHILPVRLIIPPSLIFVLVALILICVIALTMMVRVVTQPALSQALRINED